MNKIIAVTLVSDGILITFDDSNICYCAAEMLYQYRSVLTCQRFLDHDPCSEWSAKDVPGMRDGHEGVETSEAGSLRISSHLSQG